jgi:probable phosphoglycerate mutase
MKILIVRHGDPDYENDTLTETGWKEAALLADRLSKLDIKEFYMSPLGRAKDTASVTLKKMGRCAEELEWMQEFFRVQIDRPDADCKKIAWDWLPQDWTKEDAYYRLEDWMHTDIMEAGGAEKEYRFVSAGLDALLAKHGYVREERYYRVEKPNKDTIVFFCHFGVECVMLAHMLGVSPMVLWHGFVAAPTSVTTIYTEERREGIASFRVGAFGDISHLYIAGREPSFSARFCEVYSDVTRHD